MHTRRFRTCPDIAPVFRFGFGRLISGIFTPPANFSQLEPPTASKRAATGSAGSAFRHAIQERLQAVARARGRLSRGHRATSFRGKPQRLPATRRRRRPVRNLGPTIGFCGNRLFVERPRRPLLGGVGRPFPGLLIPAHSLVMIAERSSNGRANDDEQDPKKQSGPSRHPQQTRAIEHRLDRSPPSLPRVNVVERVLSLRSPGPIKIGRCGYRRHGHVCHR